MFRHCDTCKKEFNEYLEGAYYSSAAGVVLYFCSDECVKNYFNKENKLWNDERSGMDNLDFMNLFSGKQADLY